MLPVLLDLIKDILAMAANRVRLAPSQDERFKLVLESEDIHRLQIPNHE
jgi:hypothetical protein